LTDFGLSSYGLLAETTTQQQQQKQQQESAQVKIDMLSPKRVASTRSSRAPTPLHRAATLAAPSTPAAALIDVNARTVPNTPVGSPSQVASRFDHNICLLVFALLK
jgi:hypothetical protein